MDRAMTLSEVMRYKGRVLPFDGKWKASFGQPELGGVWIIYGQSANGKTHFAFQMAKYLAQLDLRVAYNALEQGVSESIKTAIYDTAALDVQRSFDFLNRFNSDQMAAYLERQRSASAVFIDSVQDLVIKYDRDNNGSKLFDLIKHFNNQRRPSWADRRNPEAIERAKAGRKRRRVLFVIVSQADGNTLQTLMPSKSYARTLLYDSDLKIRVFKFSAYNTGRFGGGEPFKIWENGDN